MVLLAFLDMTVTTLELLQPNLLIVISETIAMRIMAGLDDNLCFWLEEEAAVELISWRLEAQAEAYLSPPYQSLASFLRRP